MNTNDYTNDDKKISEFRKTVKTWQDKLLLISRKNKQIYFDLEKASNVNQKQIIKLIDESVDLLNPDKLLEKFAQKPTLSFDLAVKKQKTKLSTENPQIFQKLSKDLQKATNVSSGLSDYVSKLDKQYLVNLEYTEDSTAQLQENQNINVISYVGGDEYKHLYTDKTNSKPVEIIIPRLDDDLLIEKYDLSGDCSPLELKNKLREIRNRARVAEQERGLNILYLAMGFLKWTEINGDIVNTPILLLPCKLELNGPRSPFQLTLIEDIPSINTMLNIFEDLSLNLKETLSENEQPSDFFETLKNKISQHPDWTIDESICLTTFNFANISMWNDLNKLRDLGYTSNQIVNNFAGQQDNTIKDVDDFSYEDLDTNELKGGRLDDIFLSQNQFNVTDTDFSQLIAIEKAKLGKNLIIDGPPGTGKSQTITNIISSFLANGKSVLFVSEKKAALEVVKSRLDNCNIGDFCFELHSQNSAGVNKADIYQQLENSLMLPRASKDTIFSYEDLDFKRRQLNKYVRKLHDKYPPLDETLFDIQSKFGASQKYPNIELSKPLISNMDKKLLLEIYDIIQRITRRPNEFKDHNTSMWHILTDTEWTMNLSENIQKDMQYIDSLITKTYEDLAPIREELGLNSFLNIQELEKTIKILQHFFKEYCIPEPWFKYDIQHLKKIISHQFQLETKRKELINKNQKIISYPFNSNINYYELSKSLTLKSSEHKLFEDVFSNNYAEKIYQEPKQLINQLSVIGNIIPDLVSETTILDDFLDQNSRHTSFKEIKTFIDYCNNIYNLPYLPETWRNAIRSDFLENNINHSKLNLIKQEILCARDLCNLMKQKEHEILTFFDSKVFDLINYETQVRFKTLYQNKFTRWLRRDYRNDRNILKAYSYSSTTNTFENDEEFVYKICEFKKLKEEWSENYRRYSDLLENKFNDRKTIWNDIEQEINTVENFLAKPEIKNNRLIEIITSTELLTKFKSDYVKLKTTYENLVVQTKNNIDLNTLNKESLVLNRFLSYVQDAKQGLQRIEESINLLKENSVNINDIINAERILIESCEIIQIDQEIENEISNLKDIFLDLYESHDTDWKNINDQLDWYESISHLLDPEVLNESIKIHLTSPQKTEYYQSRISTIQNNINNFHNLPKNLLMDYNFEHPGVIPWDTTTEFNIIKQQSGLIAERSNYAGNWLLYNDSCKKLDELLGFNNNKKPYLIGLIREQTENVNDLIHIFNRKIYNEVLDTINRKNPDIQQFNRLDQDARIREFQNLDKQFKIANQEKVRKEVLTNYPNSNTLGRTTNSEIGILRSEISKKRKKLPLRQLVQKIPNLLHRLKPCFLMSPLAVSQYIPFEEGANSDLFDVVIFDEASQIEPQDAIPSILRGKSVILAGDEKQLPPDSRFKRLMEDEYYDIEQDENEDEASDNLDGMESILSAAKAKQDFFHNTSLNVHYRSQNDELINFSNSRFYSGRLHTFPSSTSKDDWSGVKSRYLPEGKYYSASSEQKIPYQQSNPYEAQTIANMVVEHMRTRAESLGVVAMSLNQAKAIESELERLQNKETDLLPIFNSNEEEPFFIKNLDNVQGDERDRIIISVGYGPSAGSGKVVQRFGDINKRDGSRRLNVLITRARQRIDLVHSLKATDIISPQQGAKLLREYIEYAENPKTFFENRLSYSEDADYDSEFEKSVREALELRGHKLEIQIGQFGYRIDMAIMSDDGVPLLGIETDGATYHSHPAARDRDMMRQQILENLGWTIHRVWSTSWYRNPDEEIRLIEDALNKVLLRGANKNINNLTQETINIKKAEDNYQEIPLSQEIVINPIESFELKLIEYEHTELEKQPKWLELKETPPKKIRDLIIQVVDKEGPVHEDLIIDRLRDAFSMGSVRGSTRTTVQYRLEQLVKDGALQSEHKYFWNTEQQISSERTPRNISRRKAIDLMYPGELENIITGTLREIDSGIDLESLIKEIGLKLSLARSGQKIKTTLNKIIKNLLDRKLIEYSNNGMIRLL